MRVRVVAFARVRELVGFGERLLDVAADATPASIWSTFERSAGELAGLRDSTRFAVNGALAVPTTPLRDGDELALLPPVGGG
jgi:molybdopterin converting factor small subunit